VTPTGAGEDALIEALTARLPLGAATLLGPGDDSAVLAAPDGRFTATTDILVEGVHFRDAWSSGFDVGWRLAAQNLADAAAMGGVPTCLVVALAGPPERLGGQWGVAFAEGLAAYCDRWGVGVAGGDLSSAPLLVACGTAFGDLAGREPVTRSGARPGDVVALSDVVA
jgi:thiamine-monophosphate kinase